MSLDASRLQRGTSPASSGRSSPKNPRPRFAAEDGTSVLSIEHDQEVSLTGGYSFKQEGQELPPVFFCCGASVVAVRHSIAGMG